MDEQQHVSVHAALSGQMSLADIRLTPDVLRSQAQTALENGNPQMAASLVRAAELCALPDDEIMALYEALRPHRSTSAELQAWVHRLEDIGATTCAAYVADAQDAYQRRDLLRTSTEAGGSDYL